MDQYVLLVLPPELQHDKILDQLVQNAREKQILTNFNMGNLPLSLSIFISNALTANHKENTSWTEVQEFVNQQTSLESCETFDLSSNWSHHVTDCVHDLANQLPQNGMYYLDVYLSCKLLEGTHPSNHVRLMGSLFRLKLWHRANILILYDEQDEIPSLCDWCDLLETKISSTVANSPALWRGNMTFNEKPVISTSITEATVLQCELQLDSQELREWSFMNKLLDSQIKQGIPYEFRCILSESIEVLDECSMSLIPLHLFSHPVLKLSAIQSSSDKCVQVFMDHLSSKPDIALICRLRYMKVKKTQLIRSQFTTEKWKRDVISGDTAYTPPEITEPSDHFTFAITADPTSQSSVTVYLLQKQNPISSLAHELKECDTFNYSSILSACIDEHPFLNELNEIPYLNGNILTSYLKKTKLVFQEFMKKHYESIVTAECTSNTEYKLSTQEISRIFNQINHEILAKLQLHGQIPQQTQSVFSKQASEPSDPWDWPERLYLFQQQIKADKCLNLSSKSSNNSAAASIVNASDMRKYFAETGESCKQENIQTIQVKRSSSFSDHNIKHIAALEWPEIMNCNFHDIYYNVSSSERELDGDKMKNTYLVHETASTCCNQQIVTNHAIVQSSSPSKRKRKQKFSASQSKAHSEKSQPSLPTKGPKQQAPVKTRSQKNNGDTTIQRSLSFNIPDDLNERHKMKLREAVVFALEKFNISLDHKMFKPCARRLFAVCKPFVKDIVGKGNTSAHLRKIAESHSKQVVDFEMQKQT